MEKSLLVRSRPTESAAISTRVSSKFCTNSADVSELKSIRHCVDANGNTVEGTCEAVDRDYNIPLRIGLVFAILATASIGVFGPIVLSLGRYKSGSIVMSVVKQFGTGVIISTALVHVSYQAAHE